MGGRLLEWPTMVGGTSDWKDELGRFLKPFLDRLGHKARRQMCPLYGSGLIGPGDRKSIQPMARFGAGQDRQLPDAGIADACARRSTGHAGVAAVSSRELDEQAGSVEASGCSGQISNGTNETGDGFGGDRSCHRGGGALWLGVGGCRLWAGGGGPPGGDTSATWIGRRASASPPVVPL